MNTEPFPDIKQEPLDRSLSLKPSQHINSMIYNIIDAMITPFVRLIDKIYQKHENI
jgi:hypothetical protein